MKTRTFAFLFLLLAVVVASAITPVTEQLTVAASAVGFTPARIRGANTAFCRLETAEIRYEFGGPTATTTIGFLWEVGEEKTISNTPQVPNAIQSFNAIRTGATSGQLDCKYF